MGINMCANYRAYLGAIEMFLGHQSLETLAQYFQLVCGSSVFNSQSLYLFEAFSEIYQKVYSLCSTTNSGNRKGVSILYSQNRIYLE
jgi:hypothetical protein